MSAPSGSPSAPLLLTVTGRDHPGIAARLTGLLAHAGAQLLDVEQVVVQGQLTLCLLVRLPSARSVLAELLFAAKELGVALDFQVMDAPATPPAPRGRYVATLVGRGLGAGALHAFATCVAEHGGNIVQVSRLSDGEALERGALAAVEVRLTLAPGASSEPLKRGLLQLAMAAQGATQGAFDVALQREGLYRRSKRMVVMDMDSTLIRIEVIDELARAHGVYEQVSRITERAMHGEMDYDESLRQRVALLAGLEVGVLEQLAAQLPLTEGAETLVRVLKRLGYRTAVISGGFSVAAEALQRRLGIDFAFSNVLEAKDGKLTGRTVGPIVNARRKAELLEKLAAEQGLLLDQVIAVGDGANDLLMLQRAGLGIAFRAKPKLREAADTSISAGGLDTILYLLGLSARELQEVG
ncbi:phosphoserine phosphatase SerB [Aggregicoccus sp. 17bor-14]|uniref:phosphoserine phosphatase SerB n=1 Tax=Myxococcaceae TaxID=31 RepID=UPI00129CCD19|nr:MULTISPECIES: phosphoserine phosphatase SerB [Myxococcaceae]MBF5045063.1 phosphoserine phosphatase SerB [Simulacricoccus sp. 17bor-14]MRI90805.1 phosphoserine phosphatase SerB [Aggregicoccus sp. 17bor-14]